MKQIIGKVTFKVSAMAVIGGFEDNFAIKDEKTGCAVGNLYLQGNFQPKDQQIDWPVHQGTLEV
jgi:hypothetical protein